MLQNFQEYIIKEKLFAQTDYILLTVSGGIDSIVMCELFHKAQIKFGIAHCNFKLRSNESDEDELFVEALAEKYKVRFHSTTFNTSRVAKKNKISIQVAARALRYEWFEEIREQYNYRYIATAHHKNDSIETFFINLMRGTGISGLHGIPPKQGNIIRPLLFSTRSEIEAFSKKNNLKYREDSSNASEKYVRNKIRHKLIPLLKELNPDVENNIYKTIQNLKEVETIIKKEVEKTSKKIKKKNGDAISLSISELKKLDHIYLYEILKEYQFNADTTEEIFKSLNGLSGKQFFSPTHRVIKDRDSLIIESKRKGVNIKTYPVKKNQKKISLENLSVNFSIFPNTKNYELRTTNLSANIDFDKLIFPLEIRKWEKGDVFYPLGMKGKKKVSDFFIDKKLSITQKENTWLLTSNKEIVWIIGLRLDDRFKLTPKTKKIFFAELV